MSAQAIEAITRGLVEACLFSSSVSLLDGEELESADSQFSAADLAPESRDAARAFCAAFFADCFDLINGEPGKTYESAGHNLWFTIAGHGCGFWDGGWPKNGEALTQWCKQWGHLDAALHLYIGDDGALYLDGFPKIEKTAN